MSQISFDGAAAAIGTAAALTSFWVLNAVMKPFPPSVHTVPREASGLRPFVMQHAWSFQYNPQALATVERAAKLFGSAVSGIRVFYMHRYYVMQKDDIEEILSNPEVFVKGPEYRSLIPMLGRGLLTIVEDDVHAVHRRVVGPAFSPSALSRASTTVMTEHTLRLLQHLSESKEQCITIGVKKLLHRVAFNIICASAFRTDSTSTETVAGYLQQMMSATFPIEMALFPFLDKLPIARYQRRRQLRQKIREFTGNMVAEVLEEYKGLSPAERRAVVDGGGGKALLDYLALEPSFGAEEVTAHSLTFLFAGHETSSNAMQWALALLATHPEVQQRLFEEVREVLAAGAAPRADDLAAQCPYLECVIKETLRLYPVAAAISRRPVKDVVLRSHKQFIPQGATLQINIFAVQRDPALYGADASEFVPERWLDAGLAARVGRGGYLPFSFGSRNCIGMNFALIEIRMILATLVRNFRLEWPDGQPFPLRRYAITLSPRGKWSVGFSKRAED